MQLPRPGLFEKQILDGMPRIEHLFRGQWQDHAAPFYGSMDLRNSGFKLAPVDANLFPRGFNDLNKEILPLCVRVAMTTIELERMEPRFEQERFPQVRAANN